MLDGTTCETMALSPPDIGSVVCWACDTYWFKNRKNKPTWL